MHSLNNAMGRVAVTSQEVGQYVERMVAEAQIESEKERNRYKRQLAGGKNTYFAAEVVWRAAMALGRIGPQMVIPGFSGRFAKVAHLPKPLPAHMVLLGVEPREGRHAVAVRNGVLYDSLRESPVPFTDAELAKSLSHVFGAYAVAEPGESGRDYASLGPVYRFSL